MIVREANPKGGDVMLSLVVGLSDDQYVQLFRLNLGYKAASYLTLVAHLEFVRPWEM